MEPEELGVASVVVPFLFALFAGGPFRLGCSAEYPVDE